MEYNFGWRKSGEYYGSLRGTLRFKVRYGFSMNFLKYSGKSSSSVS